MKKKKMDWNKKLFLDKEMIGSLTSTQANSFMGGDSLACPQPPTHSRCDTTCLVTIETISCPPTPTQTAVGGAGCQHSVIGGSGCQPTINP